MAFTLPFDFYYWFVTILSGNIEVFIALALLIIAAMAAMFRMTAGVTLLMFMVFAVFMAAWIYGYFLLGLLLASLFIGWGILKWVQS